MIYIFFLLSDLTDFCFGVSNCDKSIFPFILRLISPASIDFSEKTLLIGDGLSKGKLGGYYMGTDVGWMRNILYFGILGTLFGYLYYEVKIINILKRISREHLTFFIVWFLYLFILNFKGLPDFNFMIFLMSAYFINNQYMVFNGKDVRI